MALLALALAVPLGLAVWLTPDRSGSGTHEQLGLPPCSFKVLVGVPCPSCGMTTAWAHTLHGEVVGALRSNVGGTLLCLADLVVVPWLLASALAGRWMLMAPRDRPIAWMAIVFVVITLSDWAFRMVRH